MLHKIVLLFKIVITIIVSVLLLHEADNKKTNNAIHRSKLQMLFSNLKKMFKAQDCVIFIETENNLSYKIRFYQSNL